MLKGGLSCLEAVSPWSLDPSALFFNIFVSYMGKPCTCLDQVSKLEHSSRINSLLQRVGFKR